VSLSQRVYFIVCAALIGFSLFYALPIYAHLPHHYYDPVAHSWSWVSSAGPVPLGYFGQMAWALAGALLSAGIASAITRFLRSPSERAFLLWGAWALSAALIVLGYFTWNNWP
jgi:hypothetical protein